MVSKEDLDWRGDRDATPAERDARYTLHRVSNLILAVCQFAAMICHIICFGVLLSKNHEIEHNFAEQPGRETCIFYISAKSVEGQEDKAIEYNGGRPCDFIAFAAMALAVLAGIMLIFLIVRLILVSKMNFLGLFDVVEIIISVVLAFIVSVTISIGRSVTCSNVTKSLATTCDLVVHNKDHSRTVYLYSAMKSIETSSWVAFLFLLVVAVVSIVRAVLWVRKLRREKRWNVSAGLVNSEVPSSTYEEVDKTPAAI